MFYTYEYNPSWIIFIFYFDFKRDENIWKIKYFMDPQKHDGL